MGVKSDAYASYKLLIPALEKRGYDIGVEEDEREHTTVSYKNPSGKVWQTNAAHLRYPFNPSDTTEISIHKMRATEYMAGKGYPVPFTLKLKELEPSDAELQSLVDRYHHLVVKPEDSSLGKGVTTNVDSVDGLRHAISHAKTISDGVLIQQQVGGKELRVTVINGKAEVVIWRRAPSIIGDGTSTVSQLIAKENESRQAFSSEYLAYRQLDETIVESDLLHSQNVPAEGEFVELSGSPMVREGATLHNVTSSVHPSYIDEIERAVPDLHAGFMVVDIFSLDFTQPASDDNHWFIEFNMSPVLKLYYALADGRDFDIVSKLADLLDTQLT